MFLRFIILVFLFGFWMPPLVVGRWMAARPRRILNAPLVAVAWSLLWSAICLLLMVPSILDVLSGPRKRGDSPILLVEMLTFWAVAVVMPVSILACWIGTQRHWWQGVTGAKVRLAVSVAMFIVVQVMLIGLIALMLIN
jgi:hypothetical protein